MIKLHNCDNLELMKTLPDESIDVICMDPPYLYLKNQKLERPFDEPKFFEECKRLLTKDGFIVMFGRGVSFYRWNCILDSLGFTFKEEIIWNKRRLSSFATSVARKHETIAIFSKGKGSINRVKVDFIEKYSHEPKKILETINRIKTTFGNRKTFELLKQYYEEGYKKYEDNVPGWGVTRSKSSAKHINRTVQFAASLEEGVSEQSIIDETGVHYNTIHPTQKPVRLIERLLALVIPQNKERKDIVVADWFGGSMSTMEAVYNIGMQGIATEIDEEYFLAGKERIENLQKELKLFN